MQLEELKKQLDLVSEILKIALQFIAAALSFAFSYSIVIFLLFCTAIFLLFCTAILFSCFARLFMLNKLLLKLTNKFPEYKEIKIPPLTIDHIGLALIGFIFIAFIIKVHENNTPFFGLICSIVFIAFTYILLRTVRYNKNDLEEKKKSKRRLQLFFMILIYFMPLIIGQFQDNLFKQTMRLIGVRNENAIVQFKNDYKIFVESEFSGKKQSTYEAIVLFHGIGSNSVLEISGKRFVVPNKEYFLRYK